ncbi:recombination directionality factor [Ferrovum myxofaciens]|uniref:recombination directionality factor n=1 Tax=Ferrovum myxofaciens TaxID=416213 RepID=UPI00069016CD|nr:hypothetical protein [Ferrovum myxofaciens]
MIKGLAITPPVLGRITIGKVVEKNGKRLPEKDDAFTITTQVQNRDGWLLHPLHQKLVEVSSNGKIRSIPVKLLFNSSDLNLRAEYSLFDRTTGRPVCVGNGETARRVGHEGISECACPSPEGCEFGGKVGCKPYGRLNVHIEGQDEELSSFIFRTTGFNSIRTLTTRLRYFEAVSQGNSRYLPLQLKLRAKSTTQSHRVPVYYVDLCLRDGVSLNEAVSQAIGEARNVAEAGVDIKALERVAKQGFGNGAFEDSEEEGVAIVEEFFPETETGEVVPDTGKVTAVKSKLTARLGGTVPTYAAQAEEEVAA